jgi:hypothetical protein
MQLAGESHALGNSLATRGVELITDAATNRELSWRPSPISSSQSSRSKIGHAPGDYLRAGLPNSLRNSTFAASNTRRLSSVRPEPARLMTKVSIDIAEQKGELLRRSLNSAECFRERAISRGSSSVKTPPSRSSALLSCVTFCDQ